MSKFKSYKSLNPILLFLLAGLALLFFCSLTVQCTFKMPTGLRGEPTNMETPRPVYTSNLMVLAGRDSLTLFWDYTNPSTNGVTNPSTNGVTNPSTNGVTNPSTNEVTNVGFKISYIPDGGSAQNVVLPTNHLSNRRSYTITNLSGSAPYQVSVLAVHDGVDQGASVLDDISFNDRGMYEPTALVLGTAADGDSVATFLGPVIGETTGDTNFPEDLNNDSINEDYTFSLSVVSNTLTDTNRDAISFRYVLYSPDHLYNAYATFNLSNVSQMKNTSIVWSQRLNTNSPVKLAANFTRGATVSSSSNFGILDITAGLEDVLQRGNIVLSALYGFGPNRVIKLEIYSISQLGQNFTIVSGDENDIFAIDSDTGEITIASGKASELDPFTKSAYLLDVSYIDASSTTNTQEVLIRVQ